MANEKQNSGDSNAVPMSRAQRRLMDFLNPRLAAPMAGAVRSRKRDLGATTEAIPVFSPAAQRLEQLRLFRQRQQEAAEETASLLRSGERDLPVSGQFNWVPLGPAGVERGQASDGPVVSGRVKAIAVAPGGSRVYLATANGGVWYSGDIGKTWRPLMDGQNLFPAPVGSVNDTDSLACGAIALVPGAGNSSDKIYLGTGEGDGMTDAYLGVGPLVSSDGGATWVRETANGGGLLGQGFYGLIVDPDDNERVVAATSNGIYVREPDGAGGFTWRQKAFGGQKVSGFAMAKGKGVKRFFAAIWGDKVYASTNGEDWSAIDKEFPTNRIGRISLGANPHNPNVIYAQIAFGTRAPSPGDPEYGNLHGVYRLDYSIDEKWYKVNGVPTTIFGSDPPNKNGQGNYDNAITVAPDNENRIYVGGSGRDVGGAFSATIYRCDITVTQAPGSVTLNAATEYLGAAVHADVHALYFVPYDPQKLWVGCDGGAYFTNHATGIGVIFQSKNRGLQTLTINYLDKHPTEEEILFCGAQDNGGLRYTGESMWLHSSYGDGGFYVVNWNDPTKVISSYNENHLRTNTKSGNRTAPPDNNYNNENPVDVAPLTTKTVGGVTTTIESVLFYAPLVGTPANPAVPAQANILAFGTQRPWISTDFGANWLPLPSRTAGDEAKYNSDIAPIGGSQIRSLAFADSKTLLVGTENGRVFRYVDGSAANNWSTVAAPTRLDTASGGAIPARPITDIAVVPGNPNQFYISVGGVTGNSQHVWFYDEAANPKWTPKGGTVLKSLLDVHFSALAINPENVSQLFAGSDVGVWKSDNGGVEWEPFSNNLPETAVIDLLFSTRDLGGGNKLLLLRASTYGRGVFECNLSTGIAATRDVELFLRNNSLDRKRFTSRLAVDDYTNPGTPLPNVQSPDIKIDVPDANGAYQFSAGEELSPGQFYLSLTDEANQVPVSATGTAVSRVYVQVHSRGILSANNVQVMLLIKELSGATEPDLPADYQADLQAGIPIDRDGWKTVGIKMVHGLRAGVSKVLSVDLPATLLPAHGTLGGSGKELVLVALLHHPADVYSTNARILDPANAASVARTERKISFRRIKAVQSPQIPVTVNARLPLNNFISIPASATAPEAPYDAFLSMSLRLNDSILGSLMLSRLAQPLANRGNDALVNVTTDNDARKISFAQDIAVQADINLAQGTPLIWFARNKITISNKINGKGKGPLRTVDGDFGGSGGGSPSNAGKQCTLPNSNPAIILAAGANNTAGITLDPVWASRALLMLPLAKGGGAGGNDAANLGGFGGGVVVLCAPTIEFAGSGKIDVQGDAGAGNGGGGGGGLIVLIAREIIGLQDGGGTPNVLYGGGAGGGTGKAGGNGKLLTRTFQ